MTTTQLLGVAGMEAKRVDMILAGAILFEECLNVLGAKKAVTTAYSLRDGILQEEIELFRQHKTSHISFHLHDIYAKAKRFGGDEKHLKQVVAVAETLFDKLKPIHKLKPEWKIYLTAAMILRDTGEAVALIRHEEHSFYIVNNADFPSMDKWESEFIAHLCLHHENLKVIPGDLPFSRNKVRVQAFMRLLALLRIADALDADPKSRIAIKRTRVSRGNAKIQFTGTSSAGLEVLRVERKKALFEQVFRRSLVVEKVK